MDQRTKFNAATKELITAGKLLYAKGWVPATSGNFSMRLDATRIAITVSGKDKGALSEHDIMTVDYNSLPLDDKKPSAETELHVVLYKQFPEITAVLHTHSVNATLISRTSGEELRLSNYELLKAFHGINTHETSMIIPIFANDQDIARLSKKVVMYLQKNPSIHGYLIAGHGLYTWGRAMHETIRHLEAFEFLFECELKLKGIR